MGKAAAAQARKIKRFNLPIGIRLSLAFMVLILLTGLIGILAIQQFSSLTSTTTELNSHDLPEVILPWYICAPCSTGSVISNTA